MTQVSVETVGLETSTASPHVRTDVAGLVAAFAALIVRDLWLLVRRPSRIAATLLTPALLWVFFASGFTETVAASGDHAGDAYTLSLAAGAGLLVVTLASIFGSLGLIKDRESGYLQAVLVGPTPRWTVIAARVTSGAVLACLQASVMLGAAGWLGSGTTAAGMMLASALLVMTALGLSGACTALAWHFRSIEGFHGVMAGVLMPAWLVSGAVFPPDAAGPAMQAVMLVNPLSYAHEAIAGALGVGHPSTAPIVVTVVFGVAGSLVAVVAARGDAKR